MGQRVSGSFVLGSVGDNHCFGSLQDNGAGTDDCAIDRKRLPPLPTYVTVDGAARADPPCFPSPALHFSAAFGLDHLFPTASPHTPLS
uniref:Uncharacterized protein n=1 Tax=Plectus sambesii TaxID=2011161 RepID=A0A914UKQ2_9BILA